MPIQLGAVIAERTLSRLGSTRPILARLGQPRPSRRAPWECPYQVIGGSSARVRVALGEDALQTVILACQGLRIELTKVKAFWLDADAGVGIPPSIPDFLGTAFTARLEAVVERELGRLLARAQRTRGRKSRRPLARR